MKIHNNVLIINTTQSNAYGNKQLKTDEEEKNGIRKLAKSNMKKLTITKNVQPSLAKILGFKSINDIKLPIILSNFKINKNRIFYIHEYAKENFPIEIFRENSESIYMVDDLITKTSNPIEGALRINHRPKRDELILEFGNFDCKGNFIDKKNDNINFQFNHAIFTCLFHNFIDIIINFENKIVDFSINFINWNKVNKGVKTVKKYKRNIICGV